MVKMTSAEALTLATSFRELANAVGDYRFDTLHELTPKQQKDLDGEERALRMLSEQLITKAVGLVLDDIEDGIKGLTTATGQAKKALANITAVKDVLGVAEKVVTLGGAILAKDPAAVATAIEGLTTALG